jgi:hypothetical protein
VWSSVDSLNVWCPELESLTLNGTPLIEGALPRNVGSTAFFLVETSYRCLDSRRSTSRSSLAADSHRPFAQTPVPRWHFGPHSFHSSYVAPPALTSVFLHKIAYDTCYMHSIQISQRQRVDAELLYLSRAAHELFPSDAARAVAHPRWTELCKG